MKHRVLRDDMVVVTPGNALDNDNACDMVDTLTGLQQQGVRYVIVDMCEMQLLSSAGIGSIIGTIEVFRQNGGDIVLCNVPDGIMHILTVLDLHEYLTIRKDEQTAIELCGASK